MSGKITVGRFNSTDEDMKIGVLISIEMNGKRFADIRMTIQQWGDLLSGLGYIDCKIKFYGE